MSASLIGRLGSSTHQPSLLKSPVPTMLQPLGREPTPTEDFIVAPFMNHSAGRRRKEFGAPQQLRLMSGAPMGQTLAHIASCYRGRLPEGVMAVTFWRFTSEPS